MRRLLVATTALATLLAGGCGIPDDSDVTVVGPGPSQGTSVGDDGSAPVQYTRQDTDDIVTLVQYYLQAAAGDPETATARVKAFLSPAAAAAFEGGPDPTVVRLTEAPLFTPGQSQVTLRGVQPVGTLNANGLVEPAPELTAGPWTFEVGPVAGQDGLFITKAPPMMLLSDVALDNFYQPHTIYFWNRDFTRLVPDLRYMPTSVIPVQQPTTVLGWLAAGPAPWLLHEVQKLATGTTAPDNVPAISNDTLQITLSALAVKPGDSVQMDRLRRQLQWSLLPLEPRTLEIKIGHQDPVRFTDQPYRESNPAYALADIPERFAIYNGVIHRLNGSPRESEPVPVLKPAANKGIASAAISSTGSHSFAAVVTGTGSNQTLRMGVAPADQQADLRPVRGLIGGTLGRPVWAVTSAGDRAGAVGLVTRNGQLYSFAADGSPATPVAWPGSPGPVTSVSVAPDGQRVALVSGGRLYRAVLGTAGDITLSPPQRIRPSNFVAVAAVAWSSETLLAVAGVRNDRYAVIDVSLDGALATTRLSDLGTEPVTDLTAYPANPKSGREAGSIFEAYVADNAGWDVLSSFRQITAGELVDPAPNVPPGTTPTAPFFLD